MSSLATLRGTGRPGALPSCRRGGSGGGPWGTYRPSRTRPSRAPRSARGCLLLSHQEGSNISGVQSLRMLLSKMITRSPSRLNDVICFPAEKGKAALLLEIFSTCISLLKRAPFYGFSYNGVATTLRTTIYKRP